MPRGSPAETWSVGAERAKPVRECLYYSLRIGPMASCGGTVDANTDHSFVECDQRDRSGDRLGGRRGDERAALRHRNDPDAAFAGTRGRGPWRVRAWSDVADDHKLGRQYYLDAPPSGARRTWPNARLARLDRRSWHKWVQATCNALSAGRTGDRGRYRRPSGPVCRAASLQSYRRERPPRHAPADSRRPGSIRMPAVARSGACTIRAA